MARNTDAAGYGYFANSPLVSQIDFTNNGAWRMTTSKQYDHLNRLLQIGAALYASSAVSSAYVHNDANQRIQATLADGSYWRYEYDKLGQVTSGKKYWADGTPVAGQQFEYTFDDIGNRTATKAGGDERSAALRAASYTPNLLNQVTNRTVPGAVDVMGAAYATATVTVQGQAAYRKGEFYRGEVSLNNTSAPVWQAVTNTATEGVNTTNVWGNVWLDKTPQVFRYDADGNLTNDGRWTCLWDEENRLTNLTSVAGVPAGACRKLDFTYDYFGRRIRKRVSTLVGTNYVAQSTNRFVYDGWNLIAVLDHQSSLLYSFTWGLDLSGTRQGAGGVGGLLAMAVHTGALAGTYYYAYDANGNVVALANGADGSLAAAYEYGPFGEVLRASGPLAKVNPFRFSTKYQDEETDLLYFGHRYCDASTGHWLSRDRLEEEGGVNLYGYVANNPANQHDVLGLAPSFGDLFWLNVYGNGLSDAARFGSRIGQGLVGVAESSVKSNPFFNPLGFVGAAYEDYKTIANLPSAIANLASAAGTLSGDPCARQRAWEALKDYLATPEGIADLTLLAESLLAGKLIGVEAGAAADSGALFSRSLGSGGPRATTELLDMMQAHGRTITTATEGSEALRFLDTMGAEASAGGPGHLSILLRENPSRAAAMEEFLHGTQDRLGIIDRLGVGGAEDHVADFMRRHSRLLGLEP